MTSSSQRRFVNWEERFVSHERGCRVVHYLLRDRVGTQWLAVVGTERSLRHMVYVVCDEFLPVAGLDKFTTSGYKWRARREVVDWLSSFIVKSRGSDANHSAGSSRNALNSSTDVDSSYSHDADGIESGQEESRRRHHNEVDARRQLAGSGPNSDVVWVGQEWTCRKKLKHYKAFRRNGIVISVRRFVYVMTEEKDRHIAHVEDLYEDKKQRKKLRVRWFHKPSELGCRIPPPAPDRREVFYTSYEQDLSVECVDGLATVLTPEHYHQVLPGLSASQASTTHICSRQFDNEGIRPFNIETLTGYRRQPVLEPLAVYWEAGEPDEVGMELDEEEGVDVGKAVKRGPRTGPRGSRRRAGVANRSTRSYSKGAIASQWTSAQRSGDVAARRSGDATASGSGSGDWKDPSSSGAYSEDGSFGQLPRSYQIGDHVEVLSRDSGVRGCWFRANVVGVAHRRIKVRYDDLLDENNQATIEEWISSAGVAKPCAISVRVSGRPIIRPCREEPERSHELKIEFGAIVDAWKNDGWWEGVVTRFENGHVSVYFPDEAYIGVVRASDVRPSCDWINGRWMSVAVDDSAVKVLQFWIKFQEELWSSPRYGEELHFPQIGRLLGGLAQERKEKELRNDHQSVPEKLLTSQESPEAKPQESVEEVLKPVVSKAVLMRPPSVFGPWDSLSDGPTPHTNGSSESASFDEDEGARILSMISKSSPLSGQPWNVFHRPVPSSTEEDSDRRQTGRTTTRELLRPDAEDCTGAILTTKSGKVVESDGQLESVKEERQEDETSPESSRRSDGVNTCDQVTSTGLKWKRKRHRQGDVLPNRGHSHPANESKEPSLEKSRDDLRADRTGEETRMQGNVEKFPRLKCGEVKGMPKFKKHRQGNDSSLKIIHASPHSINAKAMGFSEPLSLRPMMASLVMSR